MFSYTLALDAGIIFQGTTYHEQEFHGSPCKRYILRVLRHKHVKYIRIVNDAFRSSVQPFHSLWTLASILILVHGFTHCLLNILQGCRVVENSSCIFTKTAVFRKLLDSSLERFLSHARYRVRLSNAVFVVIFSSVPVLEVLFQCHPSVGISVGRKRMEKLKCGETTRTQTHTCNNDIRRWKRNTTFMGLRWKLHVCIRYIE